LKQSLKEFHPFMNIHTSKRLEGIGEYYFSQKLREIDELNKQGKQIINLGIGSPDLPPHPDVIKTLQEESAKTNVHAYQSYKGSPVLRKAVADWYSKWYGVTLNPDTEILPLIGSKEGIMHICMTYLNEGDKVLVPNPGYPTYRSAVKLAGGECVDYELKEVNNWFPDFEALDTVVAKGGFKLMWVNYPQMPTGQLPDRSLFEKLVAFGKKHNMLICHDNPYSFILNETPASLLSVEGAKEVAIELNSLSKSQNMAGWRIGTLCGAKERIDEVLRFKSNMDSGMFLPAQLAAAKALGCVYDKSQAGMFVWAKIPAGYKNGFALSDEILYNANVFITPGGIFGSAGDQYIRVSLCSPEEKLIDSIKRIQEHVTLVK
jgi:LL-diaminopimelate aminotransferase